MEYVCEKCYREKIFNDYQKYQHEKGNIYFISINTNGYCRFCGKQGNVELMVDNSLNSECEVQINEEYCDYKGSEDVLLFIKQFLAHNINAEAETILKTQFNEGYCYYFAVILKAAFNRGEVCWCAPYSHICWVDDDGTPYDIYGICISEADHFIPVSYLGECLKDFLHINNPHCSTEEELQDIINRYLNDKKEKYLIQIDASFGTIYVDVFETIINRGDKKARLYDSSQKDIGYIDLEFAESVYTRHNVPPPTEEAFHNIIDWLSISKIDIDKFITLFIGNVEHIADSWEDMSKYISRNYGIEYKTEADALNTHRIHKIGKHSILFYNK